VVELAIILPAFLLILLGTMDFGKVFNYWQSTTQAAATGARAGAVDHWPAGMTLQEWVRSQLKTKELHDDAEVCVEFPDGTYPDPASTKVGSRITVIVKIDYGVPLVNAFVHGATVPVVGKATMRIEVDSARASGVDIDPAQNIGSCT
jgi:TadE-like protein